MAPKLVVIVGQTASGKSTLAMELAKRFNGEIISADSRAIYKGMDILTAKPSKQDQASVKHYLLDIVEPGQVFNAADFKKLANQAIDEISQRGKIPLLVGGSGLYINSVIYDFSFSPESERNQQNQRHRTSSPKDDDLRPNTLILGLQIDKNQLQDKLTKRVDKMVAEGLINELQALLNKYPNDLEVFKAPGIRAFKKYFNGEIDLDEAKRLFVNYDLQLAKKQRTWFKRNNSIHWIHNLTEAKTLVNDFLNK